jgi:hypothetical protein
MRGEGSEEVSQRLDDCMSVWLSACRDLLPLALLNGPWFWGGVSMRQWLVVQENC